MKNVDNKPNYRGEVAENTLPTQQNKKCCGVVCSRFRCSVGSSCSFLSMTGCCPVYCPYFVCSMCDNKLKAGD